MAYSGTVKLIRGNVEMDSYDYDRKGRRTIRINKWHKKYGYDMIGMYIIIQPNVLPNIGLEKGSLRKFKFTERQTISSKIRMRNKNSTKSKGLTPISHYMTTI